MASLGQELKNLRTELKEHRINALEGNQRPVDPNQKGRQNATRFCGYCRTNGHTPNYCRKKMRDEENKKLQNEATAEKKVTFTKITTRDEDLPTDLGIGQDGTIIMGGSFRPNNQNPNTSGQSGSLERRDYPSNNNDRYSDYRARSPYQSDQDQSRNWGNNDNYSRSPSTSRQNSSLTDSRGQPRSNSPNPSVFNRFGNRDPSNNISYGKKFPTSNNGNQPNVVRFTTTEDEINELSRLCPLNY